MARRLNYFVPQGLRWITQPIFGYIFDKKILNLDTEHLKQVRRCVVVAVTDVLDALLCRACSVDQAIVVTVPLKPWSIRAMMPSLTYPSLYSFL
jgi:hypothetical protein